MRKRTLFITVICMAVLLASCASTQTETEKQPAAKAEQFFDSTFVGILPAADAPGINTRLTLNADYTFSCTQQGLGKVSDVFKETGKWEFTAEKKIQLFHDSGMVTYYKIINENEIQLLGIENVDELNSPLAEFYILKRETK
ncbi:copper resistance protein NlpE [Treponema phagedenis]|uniref:Copper resistance protein NlpE n=1 Tax=Treponema phagedenis TaxID=162 RepID=A0A0B7GYL7_TREPH|nr:copper resistance protein NlpE [Treponema phagedenis]QEJ95932.1 copper resistance protein NlpE [Treponema phagedenis]QEK05378.1 copper resistance protein NlpE [Treponema phagedenis]QSH98655.1 copper resistance protein NlpE [Treponema phagedenis]CEM61766.1 conserved exported hypothetical protein [Treponema phagedenis]